MPASSIFLRTGLNVASVADARQSFTAFAAASRAAICSGVGGVPPRRPPPPPPGAAGIPASASAWFDISSISPRPIVW